MISSFAVLTQIFLVKFVIVKYVSNIWTKNSLGLKFSFYKLTFFFIVRLIQTKALLTEHHYAALTNLMF